MKKILTIAAVSAMLLSGCSFMNQNAVITVNGDKITQAEFDSAFDKEINNSMFKAFGGAKNFLKSDDNVMYLIYKEKVAKELDADTTNAFVSMVSVDVAEYAKTHFEKSVRKTLTIPAWLNIAAQQKNINFSQTLQEALLAKIRA